MDADATAGLDAADAETIAGIDGAETGGEISLIAVRKLLGLSRVITRSAPSTKLSWLKSYGLLGWARFRKLAG